MRAAPVCKWWSSIGVICAWKLLQQCKIHIMLRLSSPSSSNAIAASSACRAGSLRSCIKGVGVPLKENWRARRRRGRRLSVECAVEKNVGHIGVGGEKLGQRGGRASSPGAANCSRVEALPRSAKDLEERFGQPGVKFLEAAGYTIVEMRLNEGSSARVVLQSALVASFKSVMWHGGVEELLYTAVVPGLAKPTTVGGVALRVWEADVAGHSDLNLLDATECWDVENVRSNPSQFVQITLSTTSESRDSAAGAVLQFKYVFTLTEVALSCALITTNVGNHPVYIHGSLQTSFAVNFVDGVYAIGLQGYECRPSPLDEVVVEEEEMVRMKGGMDRVYTDIQHSVSLLDRGKRRTVNFHCIGFEDVRISNPGDESQNEEHVEQAELVYYFYMLAVGPRLRKFFKTEAKRTQGEHDNRSSNL